MGGGDDPNAFFVRCRKRLRQGFDIYIGVLFRDFSQRLCQFCFIVAVDKQRAFSPKAQVEMIVEIGQNRTFKNSIQLPGYAR